MPETVQDRAMMPNPKILVVDDREANLVAMAKVLAGLDAQLVTAMSGNEALGQTLRHDFALILLDVQMPDMDGFETAAILRENEGTKDIPIIFVTAAAKEESFEFRGYESGAVDYLTKPINELILRSKVSVFLELSNNRTALKNANEMLQIQATVDPLTSLFNRRKGMEIIDDEMARVSRKKQDLTIIMIDLDHFKQVNDTHGHDAGDAVLVEVAARLKNTCRSYDSVVRWGGEEIIVICPHTDSKESVLAAERFRKIIADTSVNIGNSASLTVTASLGVCCSDTLKNATGKEMISNADNALYMAKSSGRNRVSTFEVPIKEEGDNENDMSRMY